MARADRDQGSEKRSRPGASIEEVRDSIGRRIAQLRMEHGYSIRTLAERAGISPSLISNAERGKVEPSLASLRRVAAALGTGPGYFLAEADEVETRVVRAARRPRIHDPKHNGGSSTAGDATDGVRLELLTPEMADLLKASVAHVAPGASDDRSFVARSGEVWGLVLEGRLKVWVGTQFEFLGQGDSIWHRATIPHRVENLATEPGEILWVQFGAEL